MSNVLQYIARKASNSKVSVSLKVRAQTHVALDATGVSNEVDLIKDQRSAASRERPKITTKLTNPV